MDDITTRTTAWLAFTLTFDSSATLCDYLRREGNSPEHIAQLIHDHIQRATNGSQNAVPPGPSAHSALGKALSQKLNAAQLHGLKSAALRERISAAHQWQQSSPEHHLLGLDHQDYPSHLRDTTNPPPLLYAKGDLEALRSPAVAIVGSRKASRQAIDLTYKLAAELAERGVTIVSGLARGIDAAAHEGALAVGGRTIAVAATEPRSVYPNRHAKLERRIIDNLGLVLTEYPLGSPTLRWYFPRRNRIISGLSMGVLVAEAGLPSGTLTTAAHAADQGREVMAVPGSVLNPQAKGCHALIKQGAALVECEQDILEVLGLTMLSKTNDDNVETDPSNQRPLDLEPADSLETCILTALCAAPSSIDELMTHVNSTVTELTTRLGLMEIEGKIKTCSGGRYTRC